MYRNGINIYPTCGMACASNLRVSCGLPNTNKPPILDLPNSTFVSSGVPPSRNNANIITRASSQSQPYRMLGMCKVSILIYDSDLRRNCLLYARYVTFSLEFKWKAESTLFVDSAVLLNCKRPLIPLKCVM